MTQTIYLLGDTIGWLGILYFVYSMQKKNKSLNERISWLREKIEEEMYAMKEMGKIERKTEMDAIFLRLASLETRLFDLRFDLRDRLNKMEGEKK